MFACVPNPGKQSIWRQCPPSARQESTKKLPNHPVFTHVRTLSPCCGLKEAAVNQMGRERKGPPEIIQRRILGQYPAAPCSPGPFVLLLKELCRKAPRAKFWRNVSRTWVKHVAKIWRKKFADFRPSISSNIGCKKFHDKNPRQIPRAILDKIISPRDCGS